MAFTDFNPPDDDPNDPIVQMSKPVGQASKPTTSKTADKTPAPDKPKADTPPPAPPPALSSSLPTPAPTPAPTPPPAAAAQNDPIMAMSKPVSLSAPTPAPAPVNPQSPQPSPQIAPPKLTNTGPVYDPLSGFKQTNSDFQNTGAAVSHTQPAGQAQGGEEAQPPTWGDVLNPALLGKKILYQAERQSPQIAAMIGGGAVGGAVGGPIGAAAGAGVGAAVSTMAQAMGPAYAQAITAGQTPDQAWDTAFKAAGQDAGFAALAGVVFGIAPLGSVVKNMLLQIFVAQPAVSALQTGVENAEQGQPLTAGQGDTYAQTVLGTAPLAVAGGAVHAILPKGGAKPATNTNVETPAAVVPHETDAAILKQYGGMSDQEIRALDPQAAAEAAAEVRKANGIPQPTPTPTRGIAPSELPPAPYNTNVTQAGIKPATTAPGYNAVVPSPDSVPAPKVPPVNVTAGGEIPAAVAKKPSGPPPVQVETPAQNVPGPDQADALPGYQARFATFIKSIASDPRLTPEDKATLQEILNDNQASADQGSQPPQEPQAVSQGAASGQPEQSGKAGAPDNRQPSVDESGTNWHGTADSVGHEAPPEVVAQQLQDPAIAERVKAGASVDTSHDIPYLAGYSQDGKTVFFDQTFAKHLADNNGLKLDNGTTVPADVVKNGITFHEATEKALIDTKGMKYPQAHEIATGAENAYYRKLGLDPAAINRAYQPFVKQAAHESIRNVPKSLDLTPYTDEHATALKAKMEKAETAVPPARTKLTKAAPAKLMDEKSQEAGVGFVNTPEIEAATRSAQQEELARIKSRLAELGKGEQTKTKLKAQANIAMRMKELQDLLAKKPREAAGAPQPGETTRPPDQLPAKGVSPPSGGKSANPTKPQPRQGVKKPEPAPALKKTPVGKRAPGLAKFEQEQRLRSEAARLANEKFGQPPTDTNPEVRAKDAIRRRAFEDQYVKSEKLKEAAAARKGKSVADQTKEISAELQKVLGKDEFPDAVNKLVEPMTANEARALAKEFTGRPTSSKSDAIKAILARHQAIKTTEAKLKASGGRSAADQTPISEAARRTGQSERDITRQIEKGLNDIVHSVAPQSTVVLAERGQLSKGLEDPQSYAHALLKAGAKLSEDGPRGLTSAMPLDAGALIQIAVDHPDINLVNGISGVAYHEAYHAVEMTVMPEKDYLRVNQPDAVAEARRIAGDYYGMTPDQADALPGYEARAIAADAFSRGYFAKGPIATLNRVIAKMGGLIRRARSFLSGVDQRSLSDIYRKFYGGDYARMQELPHYRDIVRYASPVDENGVDRMPRSAIADAVARQNRADRKTFGSKEADELYKLSGKTAERNILAARLRDAARAAGYDKDRGENIYLHNEDLKGKPLSAADAKLREDAVMPAVRLLQRAYGRFMMRALQEKTGKEYTEQELEKFVGTLNPEHQSRLVVGKTPEFDKYLQTTQGNPIRSGYGGKLAPSASAAHSRAYFALESGGDRMVISRGADKNLVNWSNKRAIKLAGTESAKLKIGEQVKIGSRTWEVKNARTPEIEANTDTKYYKDALAATVNAWLELERLNDAHDFMDELKSDPQFGKMAVSRDSPQPDGWVAVDTPGLRNYWVDPKLANPINDYLKGGARILSDEVGNKLEVVNRLAIGAFFWQPFTHALNVGFHWAAGRGFDWYNVPRVFRTGVKAIAAVATQNDLYRDYMRSGSALISSKITNQNFIESMLHGFGHAIEKNPGPWRQIANKFGYENVAGFVKSYYQGVSKVLWQANDVFMLQRIMELEEKGLTREAAIARAGSEIPDYRVPAEVLGSRIFSQMLQDPNIFNFNRYHYGMFRALADPALRFVKPDDASSGMGKGQQRLEAIGQYIALAFLVTAVAPLIQQLPPWLRSFVGKGPMTVPLHLEDVAKGNENFLQVIDSFTDPAPLSPISMGLEAAKQAAGQDMYVNKKGIQAVPFSKASDKGPLPGIERRSFSALRHIPAFDQAYTIGSFDIAPALAKKGSGQELTPEQISQLYRF